MKATFMKNIEQAKFIIVNGVQMTLKEFNKIKAKRNGDKSKKKHKHQKTEINLLGDEIKKIVKHAAPIKSLAAYYDNGYRQWGHKVEEHVFNNRYIKKPFSMFRITAREIHHLIADIEVMSKKNDNSIFEYIDTLRYKLMDIEEELIKLNKAIAESEICEIFKNEKFINEKGRRLGLSTLLTNANISVYKLKEAIENIEKIEKEVEMNIEYDPYTLKRFN